MEKVFNKKNLKIAIVVIFLIYVFSICFTISSTTKYNSAPDEAMKYDVCKYIAKYLKLPHGADEEIRDKSWGISYAFTPILSYMISAVFMKIAMIVTNNEYAIVVAARFVSVLCITGYAFMCIKISQKLFKGLFKWLFIVFATLMPQLLYLGSYINNDSLALLSISIIVYSWIIGFESNWSWKSCILLGIGIGICSLSYYNAYGYILCSIIIYIASCFIKKIKFKEFLKKGLLIALIAFLIGGWWFIRSFIIYDGDFLGLNSSRECGEKYALDFLKPSKRETPSKRQMGWRLMVFKSGWTRTSVLSFIGVFGGMTEKMSLPVYLFYFISLLLGMICFVLNLIIELFDIIDKKQKNEKKEKSKLFEKILFYIIMIASIIIPTFLSVYYSYYMDYQPQGRYLMPAMIPLMFFVVKGLEKIFDNEKLKKFNKFFFGLIILLWVVMPIYVYFQYIRVL